MNKKHLSDVLTVKEILECSNNRICILAGVGAGKNTFVTQHLKGHGNIFFISSRRATVNQMLLDEICKEKVDWNKISDDICTTTNYGVELLVKNKKFSSTGIKNIIEHFDMIVVDEFHSLKADATFSDSVFHVSAFLDYISKSYPHIKIIVMTGTDEPITDILEKNNYHIIDKRSECINVLPSRIEVIKNNDAIRLMRELPDGQQTVYYTNSAHGTISKIKNDPSIYEKLSRDGGYSIHQIAFAMSEDAAESIMTSKGKVIERKRSWKNSKNKSYKIDNEDANSKTNSHIENLNRKVHLLRRYLIKKERLPQHIKVLVTTSTLKEGVNIKSSRIKVAFCDSHLLSDIQQFAGRFRNGLETLYIIENGKQFDISDEQLRANFLEIFFDPKVILQANSYLNSEIKNESSYLYKENWGNYNSNEIVQYNLFCHEDFSIGSMSEAANSFIKLIENGFRFIRFNHLIGTFQIFATSYREQTRINDYFKKGWETQVKAFCHEKDIGYSNSTASKTVDIDKLNSKMEEYLHKKITDETERTIFISLLTFELGINSNSKLRTIRERLKANNSKYTFTDGNTTTNKKRSRYYEVMTHSEYDAEIEKKAKKNANKQP